MGNVGYDEVVAWEALVKTNTGACSLIRRSFFPWEVFTGVPSDLYSVGLDGFKTGKDDRCVENMLTADLCLQRVCFVSRCTWIKLWCLTEDKINCPVNLFPD